VFFGLGLFFASRESVPQIAGDANGDRIVNVGDVVYEVTYLHKDGPGPHFYACGDPNADCTVNVGDIVYLVNYLYKDGPDPQILDCGWSEPVNLGAPINSPASDVTFRMTPDGRMAAWGSNRPGTYGNDDIWYSYWNSISGTWSEPQNCGPNINGMPIDHYPSFSADGRRLYCLSFGRPGGYGDWDVWVSIWDSLNQQWGGIENLGPVINGFGAWSPFLAPDGSKLYFSHDGIWVSDWNGTGWDEPVSLGSNVNANCAESDPTVTAGNETLYFTRYRWKGTRYICVSHWTGTEWGPAIALGPVINDYGAKHPYITPDGSKLYFVSGRPGGLGGVDIWVSQRIPAARQKRSEEKE